jgi:hypothetical protein
MEQHVAVFSIPALRRGRDPEKAYVKSVSTWIRNQRKEPRTPTELRRNSFLFILPFSMLISVSPVALMATGTYRPNLVPFTTGKTS